MPSTDRSNIGVHGRKPLILEHPVKKERGQNPGIKQTPAGLPPGALRALIEMIGGRQQQLRGLIPADVAPLKKHAHFTKRHHLYPTGIRQVGAQIAGPVPTITRTHRRFDVPREGIIVLIEVVGMHPVVTVDGEPGRC